MKATLMLQDGRSFNAGAYGGSGERIGEVVFNTAVVGYQELVTDPANAGKILVLTYPLIGNYGIAPKFNESAQCWVSGLVIKEGSNIYSNWQAKSSLQDFVKKENLLMLSGLDTRALTVHLRNKGAMPGIISTQDNSAKELLAKIEAWRKNKPQSFLSQVSVTKPSVVTKSKTKAYLAVLDLGVTRSTIKQLLALGFSLKLFPYNASAEEILHGRPRALVIAGGPEDDPELAGVISNIKPLLKRLPILGVSLGHQVLAAALGAKIIKMKLGHRGLNYPVCQGNSYKAQITVQNHGWTVDVNSLSKIKGVKITGYNLNDRSTEEMESKNLKLIGVQYYPVSPGFDEINPIFKKFMKMIKEY